MQNAHLRFGQLNYTRSTEKIQTNIRVDVDRYMGEKSQAHLLSVFGGDAEVGALSAAIAEGHGFSLTFPDGTKQGIEFDEHASCYRAALAMPGRKLPLRHLLAVSASFHANGTAGQTFLLNGEPGLAWATLVSLLGLPADPRWGEHTLTELESEGRVHRLAGIGCSPVRIEATRGELMERLARRLGAGSLPFPEQNGPIFWPRYSIRDALDA